MSLRTAPAFASEAEEAEWFFANREQHDKEFAQAYREGRVRRGSLAQKLIASKQGTMVVIPPQDAATAAALAQKKGVEVQEYLAGLIHVALEKELTDAA